MSKSRRVAYLFLLLLFIAPSLVMVQSVSAQSVPKPSVPEFTIKITDHSFDTPTTTTTTTDSDGRRITTTTPGYHTVNGSITLSIKNQPITPYYDSDGYPINQYYHIRIRAISNNWLYYPGEGYSDSYFQASDSAYTEVLFGYSGHSFEISWGHFIDLKPDGSIDFGVEAFTGHTKTYSGSGLNPDNQIVTYIGVTGGWSETQTATIPNAAYTPIYQYPTVSPTITAPTQTVTQPPYQASTGTPSGTQTGSGSAQPQLNVLEITLFVVVGIVFAFLVVVIFFMRRKIKVLELKQNGT